MTRQELSLAITRRTRWMGLLATLALVFMFGSVTLNIYTTTRPGYHPDSSGSFLTWAMVFSPLGLPLFCLFLFMHLWKKWPIRCPHCGAPLGREKKKFYDVVATGVCKECRKEVVDGSD